MIVPQPGPVWRRAHRRQDRFARAFGGGRRCASASLDRGCARRPCQSQVGTEKRCFDRTKKTGSLCRPRATARLQLANVTVTIGWSDNMPTPRIGALPMTSAQRQARRRARLRRDDQLPPAPQRRPLPRPQRWAAAVATLVALQDEYRAWLDNLPTSLEGSRLAEKLQTIAELDLDELQAIDIPRGYGRD